METNDFKRILEALITDTSINVWHIALLSAIITIGLRQGTKQAIKVSRSKLMAISHIKTLPTYHKYFKELQAMGYVTYRPSYHPKSKSEIDIKAI
ncbi:hypothetical protein GR160_10950 [Flavobacterium sp. Sd200]|uniref:hypothetical protein n=1 Tax=Flavobacterium sp. Sd200 TaxID=2692211 RepID=UPI00136BB0EE|nr:hypothetical protein [Flavobacterium sp. Sd200]MXN91745.1 hypothetical protein [Flavobacterium sp. Sd200]